jgi:gliding motility-associated-like protein
MRIKNLPSLFFLLITLAFFARPAAASHLFGGEFTYQYIGPSGVQSEPFRYKVIYKTYVTCVGFGITPQVNMTFYQKESGTQIKTLTVNPLQTSPTPLPLPVPPGCTVSGLPCISLKTYETFVNLPISFTGYYVTGTANARNGGITNISGVGGSDLFLYMELPSPALVSPGSSSPVFSDTAVVVMFKGDTTSIINSAFDSDGDKLIYSFNNPFGGPGSTPFNPPVNPNSPSKIGYNPGFSFAQPFGANGFASINASTGLARYYVPNAGNYVISFQVKEYRSIPGVGDILIGSTIRDIQLVVKDAPVSTNTKPNFTYNGTQIITITEGQAITPINFTFTDPNPGQVLKITASSPLLDGAGGKNATFNTTTTSPATINNAASGTTATFSYSSACGQSNFYPLDITVQDNACPPGKKVESFQIVVLPYEGPTSVLGDTTVCTGTSEAYSVSAKPAATYNWRLESGGTFVGPRNTAAVNINWTTPGRHKLTAIETSSGSCQDSISVFVNVAPGVNLTLSPSTSICAGASATLSVSGGTNYAWTDGVNTFTGSSITVSPTTTTTYSVTSAGASSCTGTSSVTVTVNPIPNVSAGLSRSLCAGNPTVLTATGANTYSWTDGITTFTGNNISVTPTATTTYTVTGTNTATGCTKTSQLTITVNPTPAPTLAALPTAICKNAPAIPFDATQGSYTINGTAAISFNPALLPVGTNTVVVSSTNASNCTGTATKVITVNAAPTPNFGTLATAYCKNAAPVSLNIAGSTFLVDGVANNVSFDPAALSVGNHTVSVTTTNAQGCSESANRTVTINAVPAPSLAFLNNAYCKNAAAVTLDITQGNYTINGTAAFTLDPATLAAGTYTVIVNSTVNGCTGTATKTVTINPLPVADLTMLASAYCKNQPAVSLSVAGSIFQIDGVNATSFDPAALSVGNHTVSVVATTAQGCSASNSKTVTINAVPAPSLAFLNNAYCKNAAAITLDITQGNYTINGSTAFTLNPATLAAGTYTVVVTKTTNGCTGTDTKTVTINPVPTPDFGTLATAYCKDAAAVSLNIPGSTYLVDGVANNVSFNPATLSVGNHTVTVTTTNAQGCSETASRTIAVNAVPAPSLAFLNNAYCKNAAAVTLDATQGNYTINGTAALTLDPATLAAGTYTVVVTKTTLGCTGTATKTVTIDPVPVADLSMLAPAYCKNQPAVPLVIAGSIFQVDGVTATTFDPATLLAGNHTVSVVATNAQNCSATATRTIAVNALPTPSLAFLNTAYCKNDTQPTLPVGTSGTTITYTVNGTAATTFNPATLPAGSYTVVMNETNPAGCNASVTKTVAVNAVPAPVLTNLNASYCKNEAVVTLTSNLTGSTFTINGVTATVLNPANLPVGNHTVVVTNTSAANCTGTSTQTIAIKAIPTANFGPLVNAYCKNATAVSLSGIAGSTYTVDGVTATSFDPAILTVGSHTVTVTTTNADNCAVTGTMTIAVNPIPTPSLAFLANNYCQNNAPVTLPTGTGVTYTINGVAVPTSNSVLNPASLAVGPNVVVISETNASNCTVTATRTITIDPVPQPDAIAGPTSICPGITGVKYTIVNPGQTAYQWTISAGNGTIVSGQGTNQITVNWGAAASASITVKAQNAQGCLSAATVLPVTINPILVTPQPVGLLTVCKNQAGNVQYVMQNPTIGSSFTWTITGGAIVHSNTKGDTVTVNWAAAGTGTIVVQEASSGTVSCFGNSAPLSVTILPSPNGTLPITGPTEVCENSSNVDFTLNGGTGSTYAWTLTHGTNVTLSTVTSNTATFNFGAPGQYLVTVTETNSALCAGTPITKLVTVTPRPVTDTIYGPALVCLDDLTEKWYSVTALPGATYSWQVMGGTFTPTITNDSILVTFDNSAVKEITVFLISAGGCIGTPYTRTLILDAAQLDLKAVSTGEVNDKVVELTLQMKNTSINRQNIEVFRKEAGAAAFTKIGTIANGVTGFTDANVQTADKVYYYKLESHNECGRPLATTVHNTILTKAVANEATRSAELRWNTYRGWGANGVNSYEIYGKAGNGNYALITTVNASDSATTLSNIAGRAFDQCFRVKAIGSQGQVSWSNESCVTFQNPLAFFNIITPNGDDKNENFTIENLELYPGNELSIFNRWGMEIYTKKDYQNNWNGNGASDGTYYYLLKMADGKTYKGWFEIVH